jgi:(p)ppGpp synthase/HD superfamily hydrolase
MNKRFNQALLLAMEAHEKQIRKGTNNELGIAVPYITHPVAVAALVVRYGGNEDQVIAALLHDVLEDGMAGVDWVARIAVFGGKVLEIVQGCTDGVADPKNGEKAPWRERKEAYMAHLVNAPADVLLVSVCDKLNNLQAIHLDLVETGIGVFKRFSAPREDVLWYYRTLCEIFKKRGVVPAEALSNEFWSVNSKVESCL